MPDKLIPLILALVFLQKFFRAGKSDLSDVFFHLFRIHPDPGVDERQGALFFIDLDIDAEFFVQGGRLSLISQDLDFADRVAGVGDKLTGKDILV